MSGPITFCLSLDGWIAARVDVPQQPNPDDDPEVHRRNVLAKRAAVRDYFADYDLPLLVDRIPLPDVRLSDRTLYGEVFGAQVGENGTVLTHPWDRFDSVAQVEDFTLPELESLPGFAETLKMHRDRARRYNRAYDDRVVGFFSGQGGMAVFTTINLAFHLVGTRIYEDMLLRPEFAHAVFAKCAEIQHAFCEVKARVEGERLSYMYLGECCNTMVSPACYEEFCLPHGAEAMARYGPAEMHNCGAVTHLLPLIPRFGRFKWIELGWGTDLSGARDHLDGFHLLPRLGVEVMQEWRPEQVYRCVREICGTLAPRGPVSLHSNCIHAQRTSEPTLRAVFGAVRDAERILAGATV